MWSISMRQVDWYDLEKKHHYYQTQKINYHTIHETVVIWFGDGPLWELELLLHFLSFGC